MNKKIEIAKALAVTAELTATELSEAAMGVMVEELAECDMAAVLAALTRCRRELTGRLSLAAVIDRIETSLPTADEAFGLLSEAWGNESLTVVVPEIAMLAMGEGASGLLATKDKTGARMAFKAAYERLAKNIPLGSKVKFSISSGTDKVQYAAAIMQAVHTGKLESQEALAKLPAEAKDERFMLTNGRPMTAEEKRKGLLVEQMAAAAMLPPPAAELSAEELKLNRDRTASLLGMLRDKAAANE